LALIEIREASEERTFAGELIGNLSISHHGIITSLSRELTSRRIPSNKTNGRRR
jgi:hypothetical protein